MYLKTILIMNKNSKIFTVSPTIKKSYALQQNKCIQVRKETDKDMKEDLTINMPFPFSTNMKYSLVLQWSFLQKRSLNAQLIDPHTIFPVSF
jgi:hypothetical protein